MKIRRGSTETLTLPVDSTLISAIDATRIRFTVIQGGHRVQKENSDVTISTSANTLSVTLTPAETIGFDADEGAPKTKALAKWVNTSGDTLQTDETTVEILDTSDEETI